MPVSLPSVYYKSKPFTVLYDEERAIGMSIWQGKLSTADIQEAFLIIVHMIDKFKLTKWLANDQKMKGFPEEAKRWVAENIVTSMVASSLLRMAIIPSEDEKQVEAVDFLIERAGDRGDLLLKHFTNEEEALNWLLEG